MTRKQIASRVPRRFFSDRMRAMVEEKFVETNFGRIYHQEAGKGGSALIFLHGGFHISNGFAPEMSYLVPRGFRVLSPSLPGYGPSFTPREGFTFADTVCSMGEYLDKVVGGQRVTLVGQSMGGALALEIARKRADQVDKIILDVPLLTPIEGSIFLAAVRLMGGLSKDYVLGFLSTGNGHKKEGRVAKNELRWPHYHSYKRLLNVVKTIEVSVGMDFVNPTLVFFGENDPVVKVEKQTAFLKNIPNVDVRLFSGGHGWFYRWRLTRLAMIEDFCLNGKLTENYPGSKRISL